MEKNEYAPYYALEDLVRHRLDTYNLMIELEKWQDDCPTDSDPAGPELRKAVEDLREQLKSYFDVLERYMDIEQEKINGIEKKVRG